MNKFLSQLNESQKLPAVHKNGPLMVIAGAGSGKTRVLTYRIANLIEEGVDPFSILALTFTNKAAREMKTRISEIVGESNSRSIWMGTFHSIFARILRTESDSLGYDSNFTIYDTQDVNRLISSIIKELRLDKEHYKYKNIRNRISSLKNNLITVKSYLNNPELVQQDIDSRRPKFGKIYQNYVNRCFKASAMDFDDLLLKTNELLNKFPEILNKYQSRFKYIHVDEYQDTNHSQYLIVKALADKNENLCVVGDDAQSIYSFRGANIKNILNFKKDYPDSSIYRLEQNYRSTQNIVNAANSVISNNINKLEKKVWTKNEIGDKITINQSITDSEEGRYIASSIFENKNNLQLENNSFAVLYRTNAQSRSIEDALRRKNISYQVYGGLSFYQRKEIKDILAYFRLIINTSDEESFKRIINYPIRGIGQTTVDKLIIYSNEKNITLFEVVSNIEIIDLNLNIGTKNKIKSFTILIDALRVLNNDLNAFEMAKELINRIKIIEILKSDQSQESVSRIENIEELVNGMKDFVEGQKDVINTKGSLSEFLEDVSLISELDKNIDDSTKRVSLMTIHLSKGLEFNHVYVVGVEEDLFPSALSMTNRSDLEEERRLFYVAITRAQKKVTITYAQTRYRWGKLNECEPSRFIKEIDDRYLHFITENNNFLSNSFNGNSLRMIKPKKFSKKIKKNFLNHKADFIDINEGDHIIHNRFGKGKVISTEGYGHDKKAEVKFETSGTKKILLSFAKFDLL